MEQEPTVNVRLPRSLWNAVQTQAQKNRRSASAELTLVVERGLDPPGTAEPVKSVSKRASS